MSGQLFHQWPVKPIADICEIFSDGNWIESKDQSPSGIRLVQTGNIGEGVFKNRKNKARYISENTFSRLNCTEIFEGDCLISRLPRPVGRACIIPNTGERMITAVDCSILRFKQDMILPQFFVYYSQSAHYNNQIQPLCTGSTRKRISRKNLGKIKIPIPPLEVQQRIVSILDEAFRSIGRSKQQVELKAESGSELLQSIVESVFSETGDGWIDTTLGDISEIIMGQSPKGDSYNSEGFGVPLINGPVEFGSDPFSKTLKTKFTTAPTKMCEVNDLILCVRGSTTGRMNIAGHESCIGRGVASIRSNEYQDWVNHFINFNRNHIFSLGTGATFPNISKDSITKIRIPIPPDNERKLLVSKLQNISFEIDLLDSKITQELNSLEELKQSILQEAFNGTLRIAEGLASQS